MRMTAAMIVVGTMCLSAIPASAAMMGCSGENMAKTSAMMNTMPDGPGKMGMTREMAMANMDSSKGNTRGACMHYMRAQKMGMMKSDGMMNRGM